VPPQLASFCDGVLKCSHLVEKKVDGKKVEKDSPTQLMPGPLRAIIKTEESMLLTQTFGHLMGENKEYSFRISTNLAMSSSGAGSVNSVITNVVLGAISQFSALSGVFSEYFIEGFHVRWEPVSMYGAPLGFLPATTLASVPLVCAALQHLEPPYSTPDAMLNHSSAQFHNTGRPFSFHWKNVEKSSTPTVYGTEDGSSASYQGWQLTSLTNNYSGQCQFMAASSGIPLPASQVLGSFAIDYDVKFRIRI